MPFTILRNTFYEEALVNPGLREAVAKGELLGADKGVPVNFATLRDLGLGRLGRPHPRRARGRGPRAARSAVDGGGPRRDPRRGGGRAGEPTARSSRAELGPAAFVHDLIADGLFREPSDDLEKLLGREPTSLRDAVAAAL